MSITFDKELRGKQKPYLGVFKNFNSGHIDLETNPTVFQGEKERDGVLRQKNGDFQRKAVLKQVVLKEL